MIVEKTPLQDVLLIKPKIYGDHRGFFFEAYQHDRYKESGIPVTFIQDNISKSSKGILRGLHFQKPYTQSKLVSALVGSLYDVVVDLRKSSPTFGRSFGVVLSDENKFQLFVPKGFAHGFAVLSETAICSYKCDEYYHPESEGALLWNDPDLKIDWPISSPILSQKDTNAKRLRDYKDAELF